MQSQLTVRLPNSLDKEIKSFAKKFHIKRSDVARMALQKFLEEFQRENEKKPYDKAKNLIGSVSSGISDLGESHRKHLLRQFRKNA